MNAHTTPARLRTAGLGAGVVALLLVVVAVALGLTPGRTAPGAPQRAAASSPTGGPGEPGGSDVVGTGPNVVLVMADDMRQDDLRFAPHLRRLMNRSGVQFVNSFSPFPLCCPARASFLTGQRVSNHGVYSHHKPFGFMAFDDSYTLGTAVHDAGYRTAFVGKYLNGYGQVPSKVTGGPSWEYVPAGWDQWHGTLDGGGVGSPATGATYRYFNTSYNDNGRVQNKPGAYQTTTVGQKSRAILDRFAAQDEAEGEKPFFLYLSSIAPHRGGKVELDDPPAWAVKTPARPKWVWGMFDDLAPRAAGLDKQGRSEPDASDKPAFLLRQGEPSPRMQRYMRESTRQRGEAVYLLDRQVQKLEEHLRALGEWQDTVFVFTSDNGYFQGEHRQRAGKVKAHEPSLRVPLFIAGPGLPQGQKRYDPVTTEDLTATIAELTGASDLIEQHHPADGVSFLTTAREGDDGWDEPVMTEGKLRARGDLGAPFGQRDTIGVRTARWKLIEYGFASHGELYDLYSDPNELQNLWRDPRFRGVRDQLQAFSRAHTACAAEACRDLLLPPRFRTDPGETRASTIEQLRGVEARSGVQQLY